MKYLLDTNVFVAIALDEDEKVLTRVMSCRHGDLAMSTISLAEIIHGSLRGKPPAPDQLDLILQEIEVLPFDKSAARAYAMLPFRRHSFDRLIAAHALSVDLPVVTRNIIDFQDVPGLRFENWAE